LKWLKIKLLMLYAGVVKVKVKPVGPDADTATVKLDVTVPAVAVIVAVPGATPATVQLSVPLVGLRVTSDPLSTVHVMSEPGGSAAGLPCASVDCAVAEKDCPSRHAGAVCIKKLYYESRS
jgi:hypothetical protein